MMRLHCGQIIKFGTFTLFSPCADLSLPVFIALGIFRAHLVCNLLFDSSSIKYPRNIYETLAKARVAEVVEEN